MAQHNRAKHITQLYNHKSKPSLRLRERCFLHGGPLVASTVLRVKLRIEHDNNKTEVNVHMVECVHARTPHMIIVTYVKNIAMRHSSLTNKLEYLFKQITKNHRQGNSGC